MKKVSKHTLLLELQEITEQHLSLCIREFQNLSDTDLNRRPSDGAWSVAQCLYHLTTYGHHYLPRVKDALKHAPSKREDQICKSGLLGNYFIGLIKNPVKYKAPPKHSPQADFYDASLVAEFITQLEDWLLLMRKTSEVSPDTIKIKTTISPLIRLKLLDTLAFIAYHNERHLKQALSALGK
jgi:hypothetical protein